MGRARAGVNLVYIRGLRRLPFVTSSAPRTGRAVLYVESQLLGSRVGRPWSERPPSFASVTIGQGSRACQGVGNRAEGKAKGDGARRSPKGRPERRSQAGRSRVTNPVGPEDIDPSRRGQCPRANSDGNGPRRVLLTPAVPPGSTLRSVTARIRCPIPAMSHSHPRSPMG